MKPSFSTGRAIMNIDFEKGEKIAGAWVTPNLPGIGIYKLLAKKKVDGMFEWAYFVERDDGRKENITRGTVENAARLLEFVQACDHALQKAFGPEATFEKVI